MDQREDLQGWTMTKALGIPGSGAMAPMTSSSDRCCQMGKDLPGGTCRNDTGELKGSVRKSMHSMFPMVMANFSFQ